MASLLSCQGISKTFGARALFKGLNFGIESGSRVGLLGPNGAGKSTLLKILSGKEIPDNGLVSRPKATKIAVVSQNPVFPTDEIVENILVEPLVAQGMDHYEALHEITSDLGQSGFSDFLHLKVSELSGGWIKRLALMQAFVQNPDLLLLDEPTNHLDIEGILWLEGHLKRARCASLVVTHDRYFLENVPTRILELNPTFPEGLFTVDAAYSTYLEKRGDWLSGLGRAQEALANKVKREVEWLRRGPKARTTKSSARIDAAYALKDELDDTRSRNNTRRAGIEFDTTERKSKKFLELVSVTKGFEDRKLFENLQLTLSPGSRLGILGLNGVGKTTLLKIIMGEIKCDQGQLKQLDGIRVVYFDQARRNLDPSLTLRRALVPTSGDSVVYRGTSVHVASWASRFLFRGEQLDLPVSRLSGGEQARVLLAQIMLEPADVLILDEPTNDLDIPTLEVLEESLTEFPGALVLVTHDRFMLDRISTQLLALGPGASTPSENGVGWEYFADYSQWLEARNARSMGFAPVKMTSTPQGPTPASPVRTASKKALSFKEKFEFENMEANILELENRLESKKLESQDPAVISDGKRFKQVCAELAALTLEIESKYARWADLSSRA